VVGSSTCSELQRWHCCALSRAAAPIGGCALSHPSCCRRVQIEAAIPFRFNKIRAVDRLTNGPSIINPMDSCTGTVDLVHRTVNLFHRFSSRKINQNFLKITGARYFYKNTPELFQNSILVPIILHLAPYSTFYNYN
jgi:hypothetical protein